MATAIQMVNRIQSAMRLPQSESLASAHGRLILGHVNTAQRTLLPDACIWDNLKLHGTFMTTPGTALYVIEGTLGREIDQILDLQIGAFGPLEREDDADFRAIKRCYGSGRGRPLYYRIFSRVGGAVQIEVAPIPDAAYAVDTEALCRPKLLTADEDTTVLDDDAIFLGALMLAKSDQGMDVTMDNQAFMAKVFGEVGSQGVSNWGDVEPV